MNVLEYNGYTGSIEISIEDNCIFGKILFIDDRITYEAETIEGLKTEFIAAVNDYIVTCKEIGKEPQRPFRGSFNVRITPDLHRKAALEAVKNNISLNVLVYQAIESYLDKPAPINIEHHDHHHYYQAASTTKTFSQTVPFTSGEGEWTSVNPAIMSTQH